MGTRIERYSSRVKQSGESPNAPADPSSFSASGKLITDVGQALGTLGDHFIQAQELQQKQSAVNKAKLGINEIIARAAQDPDPENISGYAQQLEQVRRTSGEGITLRNAKAGYDLEFQSASNDGLIKLQDLKRKKIVDLGLASITEGLNGLDTDYMNASPTEEPRILEQMNMLISQGHSNGFMEANDMVKMKQENLKQVGAKKAIYMINNASTPEEINAIRDSVLKGDFEKNGVTIDPSKKKSILANADTALKKQEESRKQEQLAVVNDFGQKLVNGDLNLSEIENAVTSGAIDADMGFNFQLAISGPKEWDELVKDATPGMTAQKFFIEPLKKINGGNPEQSKEVIKSALQNYNDRKINADDLAFVLRVANGKSIDPKNKIWGSLEAAFGSMPASQVINQSGLIKKFIDRWDFQEDPREVMKESAIDQQKEDNPQTASYKINDVISRKGRSYKVVGFDDDGKPRFKING